MDLSRNLSLESESSKKLRLHTHCDISNYYSRERCNARLGIFFPTAYTGSISSKELRIFDHGERNSGVRTRSGGNMAFGVSDQLGWDIPGQWTDKEGHESMI